MWALPWGTGNRDCRGLLHRGHAMMSRNGYCVRWLCSSCTMVLGTPYCSGGVPQLEAQPRLINSGKLILWGVSIGLGQMWAASSFLDWGLQVGVCRAVAGVMRWRRRLKRKRQKGKSEVQIQLSAC